MSGNDEELEKLQDEPIGEEPLRGTERDEGELQPQGDFGRRATVRERAARQAGEQFSPADVELDRELGGMVANISDEARRRELEEQLLERSDDDISEDDIVIEEGPDDTLRGEISEDARRRELREDVLADAGPGFAAEDVVINEDESGELQAEIAESARRREIREDLLDQAGDEFTGQDVTIEETGDGTLQGGISEDARRRELRETVLQDADPGFNADDVVISEGESGDLQAEIAESAQRRELREDLLAQAGDDFTDADVAIQETETGELQGRISESAQRRELREDVLEQAGEDFTADDVVIEETESGELEATISESAQRRELREAAAEETSGVSEDEIVVDEEDGQLVPELSSGAIEARQADAREAAVDDVLDEFDDAPINRNDIVVEEVSGGFRARPSEDAQALLLLQRRAELVEGNPLEATDFGLEGKGTGTLELTLEGEADELLQRRFREDIAEEAGVPESDIELTERGGRLEAELTDEAVQERRQQAIEDAASEFDQFDAEDLEIAEQDGEQVIRPTEDALAEDGPADETVESAAGVFAGAATVAGRVAGVGFGDGTDAAQEVTVDAATDIADVGGTEQIADVSQEFDGDVTGGAFTERDIDTSADITGGAFRDFEAPISDEFDGETVTVDAEGGVISDEFEASPETEVERGRGQVETSDQDFSQRVDDAFGAVVEGESFTSELSRQQSLDAGDTPVSNIEESTRPGEQSDVDVDTDVTDRLTRGGVIPEEPTGDEALLPGRVGGVAISERGFRTSAQNIRDFTQEFEENQPLEIGGLTVSDQESREVVTQLPGFRQGEGNTVDIPQQDAPERFVQGAAGFGVELAATGFQAPALADTAVEIGANAPSVASDEGASTVPSELGKVGLVAGQETVREVREEPIRQGGAAVAGIATGLGAGRALGRASRGITDRRRTLGSTDITEDVLGADVRRFQETGGAEGRRFPPARTESGDVPSEAEFVRRQREILEQQAAEFTPDEVEDRFVEAGATEGEVFVKTLDVEPEGPERGRAAQGIEAPEADAEEAAEFETPGTSFGPELSPNFLRVETRDADLSLRPGLPDTGGRPTGILARSDLEETDARNVEELTDELLEREGESTLQTLSPDEATPAEAEALAPPGAQFRDLGGGVGREVARRLGVGSDFRVEFGGRRIPVRPVVPDDADTDTASPSIFGRDTRGQADLTGPDAGDGVAFRGSLDELGARGRRPVDRPTPTAPVSPGVPEQPTSVDSPGDLTRDAETPSDISRSGGSGSVTEPTTTPTSPTQPTRGQSPTETGPSPPTDITGPGSSTPPAEVSIPGIGTPPPDISEPGLGTPTIDRGVPSTFDAASSAPSTQIGGGSGGVSTPTSEGGGAGGTSPTNPATVATPSLSDPPAETDDIEFDRDDERRDIDEAFDDAEERFEFDVDPISEVPEIEENIGIGEDFTPVE